MVVDLCAPAIACNLIAYSRQETPFQQSDVDSTTGTASVAFFPYFVLPPQPPSSRQKPAYSSRPDFCIRVDGEGVIFMIFEILLLAGATLPISFGATGDNPLIVALLLLQQWKRNERRPQE